MASSVVLDVPERTPDNSLILLINNDGSVTVDPHELKAVLGKNTCSLNNSYKLPVCISVFYFLKFF